MANEFFTFKIFQQETFKLYEDSREIVSEEWFFTRIFPSIYKSILTHKFTRPVPFSEENDFEEKEESSLHL